MDKLPFLSNKTLALNGVPINSPVGRILGLEKSHVIENEGEKFKADFLISLADDFQKPSELFVRFLASGKPILHVASLCTGGKGGKRMEDFLLGSDRKRRLEAYAMQEAQIVKAPRLSCTKSMKPLLSNWVVLINLAQSAGRSRLVNILQSGGATVSHCSLSAFANNFLLRKMRLEPTGGTSSMRKRTKSDAENAVDVPGDKRAVLRFIISEDDPRSPLSFTLGEYMQLKRATSDPQAHLYIVPPVFVENALLNTFNDPARETYLDYSMRETAYKHTLDIMIKVRHSLGFTEIDRGPKMLSLLEGSLQAQAEAARAFETKPIESAEDAWKNAAESTPTAVTVSDVYAAPKFVEDLLLWWSFYSAEKSELDADRKRNRDRFRIHFRSLMLAVNASYAMANGMSVDSIENHLFGPEANFQLVEKSKLMLQNAKNCLPKLPKTTKDDKTVLQTAIRLLIPTFLDTTDETDSRVHHVASLENVCVAWVPAEPEKKNESLFSVMLDHLYDVFLDGGIAPGVKTAMKCMHFHVYLILITDFVAIVHRMRSGPWTGSHPATSSDQATSDAAANGGSSNGAEADTKAVHADMPLVLHFLLRDGGYEHLQSRLALFVYKFRELLIVISEQRARAAKLAALATDPSQSQSALPPSQQQNDPIADFNTPHVKYLLVFVAQIFSLVCEVLAVWPLLPPHISRSMPKPQPWPSSEPPSPLRPTQLNTNSWVVCVAQAFLDSGDYKRNETYLREPGTCDSLLTHILSPRVKFVLARDILERFFQYEYNIPRATTLTLVELGKHAMKMPNFGMSAHVESKDDAARRPVVKNHTKLMRLAMRLQADDEASDVRSIAAEADVLVADLDEGVRVVLENSGQNALHLAAMASYTTFMQLLDVCLHIARDDLIAALNTRDNYELTPMHYVYAKWLAAGEDDSEEKLERLRTFVAGMQSPHKLSGDLLALNLVVVQHLFLAHAALIVRPAITNAGWIPTTMLDDPSNDRVSLVYYTSQFQQGKENDPPLLVVLPTNEQSELRDRMEIKLQPDNDKYQVAERNIRQMADAFPKMVSLYDMQVCSSIPYIFASNDERQYIYRALQCLRQIQLDIGDVKCA